MAQETPIFPVLETPRLLLRELRPEDADDALRYYADVELMRYYDAPMTTREQVLESFARHRQRFLRDEALRWGITLRDEGRVIGTCGYMRDQPPGDGAHWRAEVSYVLARSYWNRGIATEAVAAIIRYGFEHYRLHRIEAHVVTVNAASERVLRKLGFREEGYLRESYFSGGRFLDERLFALLKSDFIE